MSEFKNLPSGWKVVRLGDVAEKSILKNRNNLIKVVLSNSAIDGLVAQNEYFDKDIANKENIQDYYIVDLGDFVYNPRISQSAPTGPINRNMLSKGIVSPLYTVFTVQDEILAKFLAYFFKTIVWQNQVKSVANYGARFDRINITDNAFFSLKILLPPLDEQEKIAEILSTWDEAINLTINLIENKKQFKKALMQNLLIAKIRFPEFQDEWRETKLGKILKERKTYQNKGFDLEHVSLTKDGVVPKSERYDRDFLVKDDNKQYKITKLNDICYNPANLKFGVICKNTYGNGIFSPIYVTFECCNELDNNFAGFYLTQNDFIQKVRKFEEGTVYERMAVSPGDFLRFKIKLPNLQEQQKIAEVLTACDDEINLLNLKLENLKKQKQGLMQKLLSGKAIVKVKGEKNVKMGY